MVENISVTQINIIVSYFISMMKIMVLIFDIIVVFQLVVDLPIFPLCPLEEQDPCVTYIDHLYKGFPDSIVF